MDYTTRSCREFVTVLASSEPAPGGGGASALVAALGTALGNMVGSLTVGKKKYADVEAEIIALKEKMRQAPDRASRSGPRRRRGLHPPVQGLRHPQGRPQPPGDHGKGHDHGLPGPNAHHGAVLRVHRGDLRLRRQRLPPRRLRRGLRRGHREVRFAGGLAQRLYQHQNAPEPGAGRRK